MADDVNSMQDSLGLDLGPPTPAFQATRMIEAPPTKHPGEASAALVQQIRFDVEPTRQLLAPLTTPTSQIYNPALSLQGMPGDAGWMFAAQYAANMQSIRAGYMRPYGTSMYGMGPVPGFDSGMLPTAGYMTDPQYGIYRTRVPGAMGMPAYPTVPRQPLLGGPFYQGLAEQMYTTPYEVATDIGMVRSAQYHGAVNAALQMPARFGIMSAGGYLGGGIGSVVGGALFGPTGAMVGGLVGNFAGGYLADSTAGEAVGKVLERNPLTNLAQRAAQVQTITTGFVTGGSNVSMSGRGVDSGSAVDIARTLQGVGYAGTTGFNAADLAKIMDQSARAGLLDSTQSAGDIKSKVLSTAGVLRQFMQITNDADITNAIKELGNMRTLGLSQHEALSAVQNAKMFARSAGTSLQAIQAVGQAGAMTYQSQGLTAGLGAQVGAGAYASARQAVMSGTMTEAQLAQAGGVSGVSQNITESSLAMLKVPMLTAAVTRMQKNGTFALDPQAVKDLMDGKIDIHDMPRMAAQNMNEAIGLRGPSALGMYGMQEAELQDQLGRTMGPVGLQMNLMRQVNMLRERHNLPSDPGGFATAAEMLLGQGSPMAKTLTLMASNPAFFKEQSQMLEREQAERAGMRTAGFRKYVEATEPPDDFVLKLTRPIKEGFGKLLSKMGDSVAGMSTTLSAAAEDSAYREAGEVPYRFSPNAAAASDAEKAALARNTKAGIQLKTAPEFQRVTERMPGDFYAPQEDMLTPSALATYLDAKKGYTATGMMGKVREVGRQLMRAYNNVKKESTTDYAEGEQAMSEIYDTSKKESEVAQKTLEKQLGGKKKYDALVADYAAAVKESSEKAVVGRAPEEADFAFEAEFGGAERAKLFRRVIGSDITRGVTNTQFLNRTRMSGAVASRFEDIYDTDKEDQAEARKALASAYNGDAKALEADRVAFKNAFVAAANSARQGRPAAGVDFSFGDRFGGPEQERVIRMAAGSAVMADVTNEQFKSRPLQKNPSQAKEALDFEQGQRKIAEIYDATNEERTNARQEIMKRYGDYNKAVAGYMAQFSQAAEKAGPDDAHKNFGFLGLGIGEPGRAAKGSDFSFEDAYGPEMGTMFRRALGPSMLENAVRNKKFLDREQLAPSKFAVRAEQYSAASDAATFGMARDVFDTASPSQAQVGVMKSLFTNTDDSSAMVLSGLMELQRSGTAEQRPKATAAINRLATAKGFSLDFDSKVAPTAAQLQSVVEKQPRGAEILRNMAEAAMDFDGGPEKFADLMATRQQQYFAQMQKTESAKLAVGLERQVNPQYIGQLTRALDSGGPAGLLEEIGALQKKNAAVFAEGASLASAYKAYSEAPKEKIDSGDARAQFVKALEVVAPLPNVGALGGTRDSAIQAQQGNIATTAVDMNKLFPDAVQTFRLASEKMIEAAEVIKGSARRPQYVPSMMMPIGDRPQ